MTERETRPARIEVETSDGFALRQLVPEDAQRYFDLIDADRGHFKHGEDVTPKNYPTVQAVLESIENPKRPTKTRFGIWDGDVMVGSINLSTNHPGAAEIGYWIGAEHKGHGYARRATELLITYAFNGLNLDTLTAWVDPANEASIKTLERAGFRRDPSSEYQLFYVLHKDDLSHPAE